MKTLYLIRHAKSGWDDENLPDHERPLIPKGIERSLKITAFLKKNQFKAGLFISSDAVRALETARLFARELNYPEKEIRTDSAIYHGETEAFENILYGLDDSLDSVAFFGHNPHITSFLNRFISDPVYAMPTSGTACIEFSTDAWTQIDTVPAKLVYLIYPKML